MKIERLDLTAFGQLTNLSLDLSAAPHQFHLIMGENESGKSTTMRAIRSWLYGFDVQTRDDYVHQKRDLRVGGILSGTAGTLACIRRKRSKGTLLDGNDPEKTISEDRLADFLADVDKETFLTQFALDHGELMRGGRLILEGNGELGELLFAAGAGLGRLRNLQAGLQNDIDRLLKPRGKSVIQEQLKALAERRKALKEAQVPPADYAQLNEELDAKEQEIEGVRREHSACLRRRLQLEAMVNAKPVVTDWTTTKSQLEPLAAAVKLADDFPTRRHEVQKQLESARALRTEHESRLKILLKQRDQLGEPSIVVAYQDEIKELLLQLHSHEKNENERVGGLKKLFEKYEHDLRRGLEELAKQAPVPVKESTVDDSLDECFRKYQLSSAKRSRITQLASEHGGLSASVAETKQQIHRIEQKIEKVTEAIDQLPPCDQSPIRQVIDQMGSTKGLVDDYHHALAEFDKQQELCQNIAKRLGSQQDFHGWTEMIPPDPAILQKLEDQFIRVEQNLRRQREERDEMQQQIEAASAELHAVRRHTTLPSIEELDALRSRRNRELAKLAKQKGILAVGNFEVIPPADEPNQQGETFELVMELVRQADELADRMKQYQKEILQQENQQAKVAMLQSKVNRCNQEIDALTEQFEQTNDQWMNVWRFAGEKVGSPAAMRDWLDQHAKLIDQHGSWQAAKSALLHRQNAMRVAVERLQNAMGDHPPVDDSGEDPVKPLVQLSDEAVRREEVDAEIRRKRDAYVQQLETFEHELDEAKLRLSERESFVTQWQKDWTMATKDLAIQSSSPVEVLPLLDEINELTTIMDDRDRIRDAMSTTESETRAYLERTKRLLDSVGENDNQSSITASNEDTRVLLSRVAPKITALEERAKDEVRNATNRERLGAEIRELETAISQQKASVKSHDALVASLCKEADCDHIDELSTLENRSNERKSIERLLAESERELARLADGEPLETFVQRVEQSDHSDLRNELRDVVAEESQLAKQLERLIDERGGIHEQFRRIDGGEKAAVIAQDIATRVGQIGEDAQTYICLKIAATILKRAIEHYRSENQAPVLKIATDYFRELTCQNYRDLKVDYDDRDVPVLHGIRSSGAEVPVGRMSSGTADALYLAFRLASLRHRCEISEPMPLIVDDCLLNLDQPRVMAAMKVFAELSQTTQVIMFSHHEFVVSETRELQKAAKLHVHRLGTVA